MSKFQEYLEIINNKEFFVVITGFNNINQAEIFSDWYEGSGEQFTDLITDDEEIGDKFILKLLKKLIKIL